MMTADHSLHYTRSTRNGSHAGHPIPRRLDKLEPSSTTGGWRWSYRPGGQRRSGGRFACIWGMTNRMQLKVVMLLGNPGRPSYRRLASHKGGITLPYPLRVWQVVATGRRKSQNSRVRGNAVHCIMQKYHVTCKGGNVRMESRRRPQKPFGFVRRVNYGSAQDTSR